MKENEFAVANSIIENTDETEYRVGDFLIKHDFGKNAYYVGNGGIVTIPESIDEDTTVWLNNAKGITELHFSGAKKSLSAWQFGPGKLGDSDTLQRIVFAEGVTKIWGDACFGDCPNLTEVVFPSSLEYLSHNAFKNSPWREENLKEIDGCVYLDNFLVSSAKDIEHAVVREGTKMICGWAFKGRKELQSVQIPDSVRCIGSQAFTGCNKLLKVEIQGEGLDIIEVSAFTGCENLKYIKIPDSCDQISSIAFVSNTGKKLYLPEYAYFPYAVSDACNAIQKLFYAACYLTSAEDHPQQSRETYEALVKKTKSKLLDFIIEQEHVIAFKNLAPIVINKKNIGAILEKVQARGAVELTAYLLELSK